MATIECSTCSALLEILPAERGRRAEPGLVNARGGGVQSAAGGAVRNAVGEINDVSGL